jgi:hypothetical protein
MKKRLLLAGATCLALALPALWFWRQHVVAKHAEHSARQYQQAVEQGDFVTARASLQGITDPQLRQEKEQAVLSAEIEDALSRRDSSVLRLATAGAAASALPPALLEQADLVLAREAVHQGKFDVYEQLRAKWEGAPAFPGRWALLEADSLLARREPQKARDFLLQLELPGEEDALRLARLALLDAGEPWKAMESLDAGLRASPRHAELLSFRAQIQEAAGRIADARLDYVAAVLAEPKNPLHRDVLAQFQLRTAEPAMAAETWRDCAEVTGLGLYAFKAWFWSRLCGVPLSRPLPEIRQQGWSPLIEEIRKMPQGTFLTPGLEVAMIQIGGMTSRPEVFWLRVLEDLKRADWQAAAARLDSAIAPEADRMAPGLATRLLAHASALAGGSARAALAGRRLPEPAEDAHPLLKEFHAWFQAAEPEGESPPPALLRWLAHPASPASMLFAHGWQGAALDVAGGADLQAPEDAPDWFDFGYARCLLVRDGPESARRWLDALPRRSAAADLTLAEILLTGDQAERGLSTLQNLARSPGPLAGRAAWTLAMVELDRGNTQAARQWVQDSAELSSQVAGKEILARAALTENKPEQALALYRELGSASLDAMIYLSKDAYARKDWAEARKWTSELAQRHPEEPQFRNNLLQIEEAENSPP